MWTGVHGVQFRGRDFNNLAHYRESEGKNSSIGGANHYSQRDRAIPPAWLGLSAIRSDNSDYVQRAQKRLQEVHRQKMCTETPNDYRDFDL